MRSDCGSGLFTLLLIAGYDYFQGSEVPYIFGCIIVVFIPVALACSAYGVVKIMNSRRRRIKTKQEENNNSYNQNFTGLYCTCSRPYPDPEDPVEDVMVQCVVCEDWYHGRHLARDSTTSVCPAEEFYEEMICYQCVER